MSNIKRGIAILHYNRTPKLKDQILAVLDTMPLSTKVVVCDDGTKNVVEQEIHHSILYIKGPNKGVGYNKNRALWALQDCHYIVMLEDDLFPTQKGWFEIYEDVAQLTDTHHFCRIQDKEIAECVPSFSEWLKPKGYTPIYASSPRGDLTFITNQVIQKVGGFHPDFKGVGYAHQEWQNRIFKAGLIPHPLKWLDIKEARDKFKQVGDTEGGRWTDKRSIIKEQLTKNKEALIALEKVNYIYHSLVFE